MSQADRKEYKSQYNKRYYQENSTYFKENARRREREIKEFVQQQKVGLACKRCGIADPRVLDFHHTDKRHKTFSLGNSRERGWSKERVLQEIAKCEVICANCHRILHWEERQRG